ncbi:MAG: hypothetical protein DRN30_00895 [Thermoplasmata archaeon]|nr:MAG: hypothetical protein DRN30_00895 [Thermoplasmata archaeon]
MDYDINVSQFLAPLKHQMTLDAQERRRQVETFNERAKQKVAFENQQNNQMIDMLWKAATDEGTPRALFENIRDMAKKLTQTMTPQQKTSMRAVVVRGLFSERDKKLDEFERLPGQRPRANFESITLENIQQVAEVRIGQVEYDYRQKVYLAGGKENLSEDSTPSLIPLATLEDKDGTPYNFFGYKDAATGLVRTINSKTDIPGDLFNKAKKAGFGPTMMAAKDFIPFDFSKGQMVTKGEDKVMVYPGISLTTGQAKMLELPMGDAASSGTQRTGTGLNANASKTLNWMNAFDGGAIDDPNKAGAYSDWVTRAKELSEIKIPKEGRPAPGSEYMINLRQVQTDWITHFPGSIPVPRTTKIESAGPWPLEAFFSGYYSKESQWNPLQVDGLRPILINGKRKDFWYKDKINGIGEHIWYNIYGEPLQKLIGNAPGTNIVDSTITTLKKEEKKEKRVLPEPTPAVLLSKEPPTVEKDFAKLTKSPRLQNYITEAQNWKNLTMERRKSLLRDIKIATKSKDFISFLKQTGQAFFLPWTLESQFHKK